MGSALRLTERITCNRVKFNENISNGVDMKCPCVFKIFILLLLLLLLSLFILSLFIYLFLYRKNLINI